jgi:hypothetical protein
VKSIEEERAIIGASAAEESEISAPPKHARRLKNNQDQSIRPIPWQPGVPIRTEQDEADWRVWRREQALSFAAVAPSPHATD